MSSLCEERSSTAMTTYSSEQMEEVWSWVHNEQKCVTTQTIGFRFGLSRTVASLLLRDLPYHSSSSQESSCYEVVRCIYREHDDSSQPGVKQSVVKLVKSEISTGDNSDSSSMHHHHDDDDDVIIYSIALKDKKSSCCSRLDTAHEMDMATLQDQLALEKETQQTALGPGRCSTILPLEGKLERLNLGQARQAQMAGMSNSVSHSTNTTKVLKRKATTAAAFFGTTAAGATSSKKNVMSKKTASTATKGSLQANKTGKSKGIFAAASTGTSGSRSCSSSSFAAKKQRAETNNNRRQRHLAKETEEEKENRHQAVASKKKKGSADDFVGDIDEDEDDEMQDAERRKRVAKRQAEEDATKRRQQQKVEEARQKRLDKDENDTQPQKQQPPPPAKESPQGRKRRKKMISKTYLDARGYMQTEQQVVWEDIPGEELQAEAKASAQRKAAAPKKKSRNTKGMKQGNIMGFFKKK